MSQLDVAREHAAADIRQRQIVHVVLMMSPDAPAHGWYRVNQQGVDMNRNNTFATLIDGYIGASSSCVSDVFAGPFEASEPEIQNELWIADTFDNIKFSNNIHSFGGYLM